MESIFRNSAYSDEERVDNLVSQMTIEEKVSQLRYLAPSIRRFKIPFYNWWNEALHGVARAGAATVFPQPIALSASFDDALVNEIGDIVAIEGRAKYNEQSAKEDRGLYKGLTFWSPNINIFRDPRWGRGHETYGEDPYLTGRMGVSYIRGIQGNGSRLKAAACVKHFAAHSGPELGRHSFDAKVSEKDLWETYYPAFETCIKEGNVEGVMGGYNRLNGEAVCGSEKLIEHLIRDKWGFDGYYVSDCGAIKDFNMHHGLTSTPVESAALAVNSGCDLNCGNVYLHVMQSYKNGLITEDVIDRSVKRLMMTRMRLGMFDEKCDYDSIPYESNDTPEHHQLAFDAAVKSIVLLKNDGILPLDKNNLKAVSVIGPNADSRDILKGNYNGTPTESYTILDGIRAYISDDTRLYYSEGAHLYRENVEPLAEANDRISEAVSMAQRSDVIFLCLGLDTKLEGEEGDANNSYAGADKPDLLLPKSQRILLEAVLQVGKPVILLNSTGSAVSLNKADSSCQAIIQVWYPGQMGGLAIASVLFGESVPSARLPITFYKTTEELPDFLDYSMENRTYRYMKNQALYPFGYGLSYGKFSYQKFEMKEKELIGKDTIHLSVEVTNISTISCNEVVQIYAKIIGSEYAIRNYSLVQFKNIHLLPGETKTVELLIETKWLMVVDNEGKRKWDGASVELFAGGSQPDSRSVMLVGREPIKLTRPIRLDE